MRLLVCGGAGFIGSNFARLRAAGGDELVVLDKLTYAGRRENLTDVEHVFVHGAIEDPERVAEAVRRYALRYRQPAENPRRVVVEIAVDRVLGRG